MALYHERQAAPYTCFAHATNMYFQREYVTQPAFLEKYRERLLAAAQRVQACRGAAACAAAFYGLEAPPTGDTAGDDDVSDPARDPDLLGYFEIYSALEPATFVDDIATTQLKELSPVQVLFLLEFQLRDDRLCYVPHRFFHRYARSAVPGDTTASARRFAAVLEALPANISAYLCRVQAGRAHAFAARHLGGGRFALLDSLCDSPVTVASADELMQRDEFAGRASCLLVPDSSRSVVSLD
eukprot:TRINITY_DN6624_c0_g1_i1.p2 TRINITY_DN6624_c0_g1~~TRINITY_DN6624_c0_g1_i1.p2  ORF type:complete len:241 (+),score=70.87 TRINITY_DN6624_c0_g1_i1:1-723(+)